MLPNHLHKNVLLLFEIDIHHFIYLFVFAYLDCELNSHKECISQVEACKKKKKDKERDKSKRTSLINSKNKNPSGTSKYLLALTHSTYTCTSGVVFFLTSNPTQKPMLLTIQNSVYSTCCTKCIMTYVQMAHSSSTPTQILY